MLQVGFVWRLLADIKHSYPYKRIHHGFLSKINNQRYYKRLEFKVYLNQISSLFVILISFFQPYHTDNFFSNLGVSNKSTNHKSNCISKNISYVKEAQ